MAISVGSPELLLLILISWISGAIATLLIEFKRGARNMESKNKEELKKKDKTTTILFCGILGLLGLSGQYVAMAITFLAFVLWTK
jgi:hypothetical protein